MTFSALSLSQLAVLFGGLGGAMVLLYILKLRRRRIEVPFSPLWDRVVQERQSSSLFRALKRIGSLLIQLALLAMVILALGDPRLVGLQGCEHEPPEEPPVRHTLVMVDASASMASMDVGEPRLDQARRRAHEVIDGLGDNPNHRAMVVQLDAQVRPLSLWTADRRTLHEAVDAVAPTGALDTATAVERALAFAEVTTQGREAAETVLISDQAFTPIASERVEALDLKATKVGVEDVNVGIEAFNVRPYLDDSLSYAIYYAIRNETKDPVAIDLFLYANEEGLSVDDFVTDGTLVASYQLQLPARGVLRDVIGDVHFAGSRLAARIEIASADATRDVFARDDVAVALVPERRKLKVQLVTEGNLFLHATLFLRENVDFDVVTPAAYVGPAGYDVTFVDGADMDLSAPGTYFVIDPRQGGPFELDGTLEQPEVGRVLKEHPLARALSFADLAIAEAPKVKRQKGDKVVVMDKAGNPLLFAREDVEGERRLVCLAFDVRKSLFPLNYAFPLLIVNVLNHFITEADGLLEPNAAGIEHSLPVPPDLAGKLSIEGPGDPVLARARRAGDRLRLSADRVGIYEVSQTTAPSADGDADAPAPATFVTAINLMNPTESKVAPRGEYPAWVAPPAFVVAEDSWLDNLWRTLLLAALALFMLEWITYNRRLTV